MSIATYQLKSGRNLFSYEFVSHGPKGAIQKRIKFTLIDNGKVFNLAFGDAHPFTDDIDDLAISNNGDGEKVLATVVEAVYDFVETRPDVWIYLSGSTGARTRLYRMGITKYFNELTNDFIIFGLADDDWHSFEKDKDYSAFLVQRKRF